MRISIFFALTIFALLCGCRGCSNTTTQNTSEKTEIRLGVIDGPEAELWTQVKTIAQAEHGLTITLVIFNDYVTPNLALNDKSIDANAYQHAPYLLEMVQSRGLTLHAAGNTFIFPLAAYSKKITSVDQLRPGAKVAIPNDPSNGGRALILLHKQGLIELADPNKLLPTPRDIVKNPLSLKLIELDAALLPRALADTELAIINTTFAGSAGLLPSKDGLFLEGRDSNYVNIVAVRTADKDAVWVGKLLRSLQCKRVAKAAEKIFEGAVVVGWNEDEVERD